MHRTLLAAVHLLFFLSGAAALIYEIVWTRSLALVFGGSHLAVASVLTVFMAGLALGSYLIGRRVDARGATLRLYGILELGIAGGAVLFFFLQKVYGPVYVLLAQFAPDSPLYLTAVRVLFAAVGLILPTTLMGGTLPVLSSLVARQARSMGTHLSFLYGFNTLGAVAGAMTAGFFLLRHFSVSTSLAVAVGINLLVGIASIALQEKAERVFGSGGAGHENAINTDSEAVTTGQTLAPSLRNLVLWGIGVSGFCALGYEVLWTRVLSIVIGASVYGFTIMLVAFLSGIASGSAAYGALSACRARSAGGGFSVRAMMAGFAVVQLLIAAAALVVSVKLIDLPVAKPLLMKFLLARQHTMFEARQWANIALSLAYLFIPAFLMGVAFPLAGSILASGRQAVGRSVGAVLSSNTVGAILGSAVSGFVLIYLFGIERSLQMLITVNAGIGLLVAASLLGRPAAGRFVLLATVAVLGWLASAPGAWKLWDSAWLAVYKTNEIEPYYTRDVLRTMMRNTEVLYYGEGSEAVVSAVRNGDYQGFITNGRTESSNTPVDLQCVYTLGHLPMLLAKNPRNVFVLGTGAGVTLGATTVHPTVEKVTLVEIEPNVLGVARTFSRYNHRALDNPKVRVVFNDGRNFLMTSREKYDVITADPVHPWFSGAGYLYTREYFRLAAEHLNPGGIICQWLPIYELTGENLRSVVRTFREQFRHTMIWMTQYDMELVGSHTPIVLDEAELGRRIAVPEVAGDLTSVKMGSVEEFLSYFLMADGGSDRYSQGALVNTDDNVYLEFSAPLSVGRTSLVADNIDDVARFRESIIPYLAPAAPEEERRRQLARWRHNEQAAAVADRLHAVYYRHDREYEYVTLMRQLIAAYPRYAPYQIMLDDYRQTYRH